MSLDMITNKFFDFYALNKLKKYDISDKIFFSSILLITLYQSRNVFYELYKFTEYSYNLLNNDAIIILSGLNFESKQLIDEEFTKVNTIRYSKRFFAVSNYIRSNLKNLSNIPSFKEIINQTTNEIELYIDSKVKICIHKVYNIWFRTKNENGIISIILSKPITKFQNDISHSIKILNDFINECENNFENTCINKYTNKQFLFTRDKEFQYDSENVKYVWKEHDLLFKKNLRTNIFDDDIEKLINHVRKFKINLPEEEKQKIFDFYNNCGRAYKSIIFLSGDPGLGKTSTIKAILNETGRHGVVINFGQIKTTQDFESIFRERYFNGYHIPLDKLCFIFEDIDACENSNILFTRSNNVPNEGELLIQKMENDIKELKKSRRNGNNNEDNNINLSCILNVLDGIIELTGVMAIIATNHFQKLDPALTRPGRIDFIKHFKLPSSNTIKQAIMKIYNIDKDELNKYNNVSNIKDNYISISMVQNICFDELNIQNAINSIVAYEK